MQLDTCGLIGRCMQQSSQLSWFCSSSCWQFFTVLFLGCLGTFWDVLECFGMSWNVMHLIWTKVWWWSNDGAAKGHEEDGNAIWETLQLRIITCWFVACSWNLVLGVSGTWTVMDSFWNLLFFGVLVQVFGILCTPLFFCVPCGCSTCLLCYSWCFFLCLAMDGLAIQEVCSQASRSGDPFSISRKPFGRTGVSCDDRAIRHNNLVHQEDCAQWSSNRVEPNVFLHASSWPCFAQRGMSIPSRTWSQRAPLMSDMLPALMTEPWMSFWKRDCPALRYQDSVMWSWAHNPGSCRGLSLPSYRKENPWAVDFRSQDSKSAETFVKQIWKHVSVCLGWCGWS